MEAMAMGKAIVSTTGGVNGLDLTPGQDVIIENNPDKFARAIERLLESPEERAAIGRQARATVEARFNWDTIAAAQAKMYRELLRS